MFQACTGANRSVWTVMIRGSTSDNHVHQSRPAIHGTINIPNTHKLVDPLNHTCTLAAEAMYPVGLHQFSLPAILQRLELYTTHLPLAITGYWRVL